MDEDLVERLRGWQDYEPVKMFGGEIIKDTNEAADEIERLRAAVDILKELHTLIDFEEPLTDETPWLFKDASDINAAFEKAYAVIVANRSHEQKAPLRKD